MVYFLEHGLTQGDLAARLQLNCSLGPVKGLFHFSLFFFLSLYLHLSILLQSFVLLDLENAHLPPSVSPLDCFPSFRRVFRLLSLLFVIHSIYLGLFNIIWS